MYDPASQILGGDFELTFELMRKDYEIFSSINIRTLNRECPSRE